MQSLNLLAAIDGPYISPSEREAMARQQAASAPVATEEDAALAASTQPAPAPEPEAVPEAELAAQPAPQVTELAALAPPAQEPEPAALREPEEPTFVAAEALPPAPQPEPAALPQPEERAFVAVEALPSAPGMDPEVPDVAADLLPRPLPQPEPEPVALAASLPAEEPALASVGPDFLPPDFAAPASPIAASPSTAFIGPVLTAEDRAAAVLQRALPSAFDYVAPPAAPPIARRPVPAPEPAAAALPAPTPEPALASPPAPAPRLTEAAPAALSAPVPTSASAPAEPGPIDLANAAEAAGYAVVSALPGPATRATPTMPQQAPAGGGSAYAGFYQFALARLRAAPAGGARQSMLLMDPPSLDPELQRCGNQPPAVLVDLDPANGLLPLVSGNRASPELIGYLADLRQRGVTVYWISGHGPDAASRIRQRLVASALDPDGIDPLIVTRFAGESKQQRRYALGESHCLLAILGDHRGDFDELYDFVLDPIMAGPLEVHVGDGWFIAPPPLD